MRDIFTSDKQNSVSENLELFSGKFTYPEISREGLVEVIKYAKNLATNLHQEEAIVVLDASSEINGYLMRYCKDNDYNLKFYNIDSLSTVNSIGESSDPFSVFGLCEVSKDDFWFCRSSMLFKNSESSSSISSFCVVPQRCYQQFLEFKKQFSLWGKKTNGYFVQVIGGDSYNCSNSLTWDELFFGEKKEKKEDLKKIVDTFLASKEDYNAKKIPWVLTLLVKGSSGNGKSSVINTLSCEYNVESFTCSAGDMDDMLLYASIKHMGSRQNSLLFVDDISEYIEDEALSVDSLVESLTETNVNSGAIIVFTATETAKLKDKLYHFDYVLDIGVPEYKECFDMFNYLSEEALAFVKTTCVKHKLSYAYMNRLNTILLKNVGSSKLTKNQDLPYEDVKAITTSLVKEFDKNNKQIQAKNKPLGFAKKAKE